MCQPGIPHTNLFAFDSGKRPNIFLRILSRVGSQPAHMGALPTLYSATSQTIKGGEYIGPKYSVRGYPKRLDIIENLYNSDVSKKLWDVSEALTGVTFNFNK